MAPRISAIHQLLPRRFRQIEITAPCHRVLRGPQLECGYPALDRAELRRAPVAHVNLRVFRLDLTDDIISGTCRDYRAAGKVRIRSSIVIGWYGAEASCRRVVSAS